MNIKKKLVHDEHELFINYNLKTKKVTIGGSQHLTDRIYSLYISKFGECDGEPYFYSVIKHKTRLTFSCNMKNFNLAIKKLKQAQYHIYDIKSFERGM